MFLQSLTNNREGFSKKLEVSCHINWLCSNNFVQSWTNYRFCYQTCLSRSETSICILGCYFSICINQIIDNSMYAILGISWSVWRNSDISTWWRGQLQNSLLLLLYCARYLSTCSNTTRLLLLLSPSSKFVNKFRFGRRVLVLSWFCV